MKNHVFISYGREDIDSAQRIYDELIKEGSKVWFDKECLLPGQKWEDTIVRAIRDSRFFLALLSTSSVSRKGFVNKEIAEALDVLGQYPESDIFLIPIRLNKCEPAHPRLNDIHRVDMFPSWEEGMRQIKKAIYLSKLSDSHVNQPLQAFIQVRSTDYYKTLEVLSKFPNVSEIDELFGEWDIMVILSSMSETDLDIIIDKISKIPNVLGINVQMAVQYIRPEDNQKS